MLDKKEKKVKCLTVFIKYGFTSNLSKVGLKIIACQAMSGLNLSLTWKKLILRLLRSDNRHFCFLGNLFELCQT